MPSSTYRSTLFRSFSFKHHHPVFHFSPVHGSIPLVSYADYLIRCPLPARLRKGVSPGLALQGFFLIYLSIYSIYLPTPVPCQIKYNSEACNIGMTPQQSSSKATSRVSRPGPLAGSSPSEAGWRI